MIVEADVVRILGSNGYELRIRRVFKGETRGTTLRIDQTAAPATGDCGGRINVELDDHVVLALTDPSTARATETAVWWVERDGSVRRSNLVPTEQATTIAAIRSALAGALPDTATLPVTTRPGTSTWTLPWLAGAVALAIALLRPRASRRPGRRPSSGS